MFEVQTYTMCDGWINCWFLDGKPQTFPTQESAERELNTFLAFVEEAAARGDMDEAYSLEDYRIVEV